MLPVRSVRAGGAPLGSPQTLSSLGPLVLLVRSVRAEGELARWTKVRRAGQAMAPELKAGGASSGSHETMWMW